MGLWNMVNFVLGTVSPKQSDIHQILVRISLNRTFRKLEKAEKAVSTNVIVYTAFGALLWIWLVAPSFNILPAAIRAALSVISYLGYGLLGASNSPLSNLASYINLGYGIVAGPPILAALSYVWLRKERQLAGVVSALSAHPRLADVPAGQRFRPASNWFMFGLAVVAFVGVTCADQNQFFKLSIRRTDALPQPPAACQGDGEWMEPWAGARTHLWGWFLPHHAAEDRCMVESAEFLASFRSIFPHIFFEQQLDRRQKDIQILEDLSKGAQVSLPVPLGADAIQISNIATSDIARIKDRLLVDPWQNWPDIRPPLNLAILAVAALFQLRTLVAIFCLRKRADFNRFA